MRAGQLGLVMLPLLATLGGCAAKRGEAAPPAAGAVEGGDGRLDDYLALLERSEAELRAQGVSLAPRLAARSPTTVDAGTSPAGGAGDRDAAPAGETAGEASKDAPPTEPAATMPVPDRSFADEVESVVEGGRSRPTDAELAPRRDRESRSVRDRCELVCSLTESTCELEDLICALARRHAGDPRYDDACARAESDCEAGREVCFECAG